MSEVAPPAAASPPLELDVLPDAVPLLLDDETSPLLLVLLLGELVLLAHEHTAHMVKRRPETANEDSGKVFFMRSATISCHGSAGGECWVFAKFAAKMAAIIP